MVLYNDIITGEITGYLEILTYPVNLSYRRLIIRKFDWHSMFETSDKNIIFHPKITILWFLSSVSNRVRGHNEIWMVLKWNLELGNVFKKRLNTFLMLNRLSGQIHLDTIVEQVSRSLSKIADPCSTCSSSPCGDQEQIPSIILGTRNLIPL